MSQTATATGSNTYSVADVGNVFRRFRADILMIAESTGALTRAKAMDYAHDAEYLAARGYLKKVDLTLQEGGEELVAVQYSVNESSSELTSSRPGGVVWPKTPGGHVRMIIWYSADYTAEIKEKTQKYLKIPWSTTSEDTSHASLSSAGGRAYASGAFGLERKDFK